MLNDRLCLLGFVYLFQEKKEAEEAMASQLEAHRRLQEEQMAAAQIAAAQTSGR